jgi:hypothetical protein
VASFGEYGKKNHDFKNAENLPILETVGFPKTLLNKSYLSRTVIYV